jgi:hypothetical protein
MIVKDILQSTPQLREHLSRILVLDLGCGGSQKNAVYQSLLENGLADVYGVDARADWEGDHQFIDVLSTVIGSGEPRNLYITRTATASSILRPNHRVLEAFDGMSDALEIVEMRDVVTTRLVDTRFGAIAFDFLKSDLQGADLEVLRASPMLLAKALAIEVEVEFISQYENQPLFYDVVSFLTSSGFDFLFFREVGARPIAGFPFRSWHLNPSRRWLWGNAIFCRSIESWGMLDIASLAKLAMICEMSLDIPDHAWLALSHIDKRLKTSMADKMLLHFSEFSTKT